MIVRIMIMLVVATLTSCSMLSPVKMTPTNKFVINTIPSSIVHHDAKTTKGVMLIALPDVRPIYNTTRMAYTNSPFKVEYFAQNEWAENPAQMLQTLLVASLEKTGAYKAVVTPPFAAHYDYILSTHIERFHQRLCPGLPPAFEVVVRVQLINANTNKVVASRVLSSTIVHQYSTPYTTVFAANKAVAQVLAQIVSLCFYDKKRLSSQ